VNLTPGTVGNSRRSVLYERRGVLGRHGRSGSRARTVTASPLRPPRQGRGSRQHHHIATRNLPAFNDLLPVLAISAKLGEGGSEDLDQLCPFVAQATSRMLTTPPKRERTLSCSMLVQSHRAAVK